MTTLSTHSPSWAIDHIGIAVIDLDEAISLYAKTTQRTVTLREKLPDHGVEIAFIDTGGAKLELLSPLSDVGALARFIAQRGPGLHHICYRVSDIEQELQKLAKDGFHLIDNTPRLGAEGSKIAFISPKSWLGVLTELCEY